MLLNNFLLRRVVSTLVSRVVPPSRTLQKRHHWSVHHLLLYLPLLLTSQLWLILVFTDNTKTELGHLTPTNFLMPITCIIYVLSPTGILIFVGRLSQIEAFGFTDLGVDAILVVLRPVLNARWVLFSPAIDNTRVAGRSRRCVHAAACDDRAPCARKLWTRGHLSTTLGTVARYLKDADASKRSRTPKLPWSWRFPALSGHSWEYSKSRTPNPG